MKKYGTDWKLIFADPSFKFQKNRTLASIRKKCGFLLRRLGNGKLNITNTFFSDTYPHPIPPPYEPTPDESEGESVNEETDIEATTTTTTPATAAPAVTNTNTNTTPAAPPVVPLTSWTMQPPSAFMDFSSEPKTLGTEHFTNVNANTNANSSRAAQPVKWAMQTSSAFMDFSSKPKALGVGHFTQNQPLFTLSSDRIQ
eukprot:Pgem_evm2s19715